MSNCIEIEGLSHRYAKNEIVLNSISLSVPERSIYGFLGANGAGKTTTLKLILGLIQQQEGSIRIFEQELKSSRIEILRRIGSLIETPSLYAQLTAAENLEVWRRIYQVSKQRIHDALVLVGLSDTGSKKAGQFSLGMKQRLSLAVALLHKPALLILDEPTNGLDPQGIIEMRNLLQRLNEQEGITILVSSHLLTEIEKLATHVGIISQGEIMFEGTLPDLMLHQQASSFVRIETDDWQRTAKILEAMQVSFAVENNALILQSVLREKIAMINQQLVSNEVAVYSIAPQKNDLESIFMNITRQ